jgi:hypothetical protein
VTRRRTIPRSREINQNLDDPSRPPLLAFDGYHVVSWSPGRVGEGVPCTEVHLLIDVPGLTFGLRMKSARALDELVEVLLRHRRDVWGPK